MSGPLPLDRPATPHSAISLAFGGLAAGLLASACCILPLALALAGISGAWIVNLTALAPYQPYFVAIAAVSIGLGFWRLRRSEAACAAGSLCEKPAYRRITRAVLWAATGLVAAAAAINLLGPMLL